MAEVFRARMAGPWGFSKQVVIKRILPNMAEDMEFRELFLEEARIATLLNHGNIAHVLDFGEHEGALYLAMEYVDGPSLRNLVEHPLPVSLPVAARIIASACEALAYVHELCCTETGGHLRIVHRDISPDNIMVAGSGTVKVVDFGIAKAANHLRRTQSGKLRGKPSYMPPERLRGAPADVQTDVFALGMVLYELLTGRKPFNAQNPHFAAVAILREPFLPVRQLRPEVPEDLQRIVHRALAKETQERYPDCRFFQSDLESWLSTLGKTVGLRQIKQHLAEFQQPLTPPASLEATTPSAPARFWQRTLNQRGAHARGAD
ncbi:hypothetical protein CYFUS_005293 [Cystobacter fuscus]|uniref:Protein kinase domain-containing protein n=2 Tax=Cystobacter fuscus TaxID=43 RepID=A0A250J7D3_9BACT|nr:hypothetical protein CYFUS_005293 [Cystobacter fuscus]